MPRGERPDADPEFVPYFEQQTDRLPRFYAEIIRKDLGPLWEWLPPGALHHDQNAYLHATQGVPTAPLGNPLAAVSPLVGS